MFVPFDTLPENSRIWIYQSDRAFTNDEVESITAQTQGFINEWTAHGDKLHGSFLVKYNRFIILAVNEMIYGVSGCSIDSSVRFIQQLEQQYGVNLLDRMNVAMRTSEGIAYKSLLDFKKMVKEKAINSNTIVFNNLINTVGELDEFWEVPASESWHKRFF